MADRLSGWCCNPCYTTAIGFAEFPGRDVALSPISSGQYSVDDGTTLDPAQFRVGVPSGTTNVLRAAMVFDVSGFDLRRANDITLRFTRTAEDGVDRGIHVHGFRLADSVAPANGTEFSNEVLPLDHVAHTPLASATSTVFLNDLLPIASNSNYLIVYVVPASNGQSGTITFDPPQLLVNYDAFNDSLNDWHLIGETTQAQRDDLRNDGILDEGLAIASQDDPIRDVEVYKYTLAFDPLQGGQTNIASPFKARILSQLSLHDRGEYYDDGEELQLGDHVWGEIEVLADAYDVYDLQWALRLSIGEVVNDVETVWDTTFASTNEIMTSLELCRTRQYDNFVLAGTRDVSSVTTYGTFRTGFLGNDAKVIIGGPQTITEHAGGNPRIFKNADIAHMADGANGAEAADWTVYRRFSAASTPTFTDAGEGMRDGDTLVVTTAGRVVNALDANDYHDVSVGDVLELLDINNIDIAAGWEKRIEDPFTYIDKLTFRSIADSIASIAVTGSLVANSPTGEKIGYQAIANSGSVIKPSLLSATVQRTRTLEAPACEACIAAFACPCALEIEKDKWVDVSSDFSISDYIAYLNATLGVTLNQTYTYHSETGWAKFREYGVVQNVCKFELTRVFCVHWQANNPNDFPQEGWNFYWEGCMFAAGRIRETVELQTAPQLYAGAAPQNDFDPANGDTLDGTLPTRWEPGEPPSAAITEIPYADFDCANFLLTAQYQWGDVFNGFTTVTVTINQA